MKAAIKSPVLCPPMKTPRGWHVVYQPDYRTPNVFNLHERGMFTNRPAIQKDYGARIVTGEDLRVAVQYMCLVDKATEDPTTGNRYSCINKHGLIFLTDEIDLDRAELKGKGLERKIQTEIKRVFEEWVSSFVSDAKEGKTNREDLKRSLKTAVERGNRIYWEWLISSNSSWIQPFIPRMVHDFTYGLYQRVPDTLHAEYRQRGGEESEKELVRKINLFIRIYESDGLSKPNGALWLSEDELWDCWAAFSGSESEAERICATIETILLPLREEIEEDLKAA